MKTWTEKGCVTQLTVRIKELQDMGNHACARELFVMHMDEVLQYVDEYTSAMEGFYHATSER
jgi:hypothetical protein